MKFEDNVREMLWFVSGETVPAIRRIERVEQRDNKGNWTRKTLLEQRGTPTSEPKPTVELYRRILYYED